MKEIVGDLWSLPKAFQNEALVITTNGSVKSNGRGVMGAGVAKQARDRIKGVDWYLGRHIRQHGNTVGQLCVWNGVAIVSLPVKVHWREDARLDLIQASIWDLRLLADSRSYSRIYLPRPGCGNGHLLWPQVRPIIEPALDDRFVVVSLP